VNSVCKQFNEYHLTLTASIDSVPSKDCEGFGRRPSLNAYEPDIFDKENSKFVKSYSFVHEKLKFSPL